MEELTSKDIEAIRAYRDALKALEEEETPERLTPEEWDEVFAGIRTTGKIPEQYAGRVGVRKIETREHVRKKLDEDGNPILDEQGSPVLEHYVSDTPEEVTSYYDVAQEAIVSKARALEEKYHDAIAKALVAYASVQAESEDEAEARQVLDILAEFLDNPAIQRELSKSAEVLDITNLPNLLPTDKRLQYAITPYRNEVAYIMTFDYERLGFKYNDNGEIVIENQAQYKAVEEAKDESHKIEAAGIDQPLLRQLFAATMKAYLCNYGNSITVSLPSFAREMNIDVSGASKKAQAAQDGKGNPGTAHNANDFFKKLKALEGLNGVWEGGSFYRVFILESYDAEENTLTFSSPWLFKIAREVMTTPASRKTRRDGSIMWEITGISSLMKPSIVSARSKPTAEIVATLIPSLKQYGTTPEAKRHPGRKYRDKELVEFTISFKTLIERIPLIVENLDACKPSNKTTLLQRYFCGSNYRKRMKDGKGYILDEYITKYTYLRQYYRDFEVLFDPPTLKGINDGALITIRHHGINGDFTQENALNELLPLYEAAKEEDAEGGEKKPEQADGEV